MKLLAILFGVFVSAAVGAQEASVYDIPLKDIHGEATSLKAYKGKVLLVVNVASQCGHTPQYKALEAIYQKYKSQGLVVLGFPCNQFAGQEPGTNEEIKMFCSTKYHVTFPLFDKLNVNGPDRHPFFEHLVGKGSRHPGDIKWNFSKFLISRHGDVLSRFDSFTAPDSNKVIAAIEGALMQK